MSSANDIEQVAAEVRYHRDRLSLLKARTYGGRPTTSTRVRELERELASAERRLRAARLREAG